MIYSCSRLVTRRRKHSWSRLVTRRRKHSCSRLVTRHRKHSCSRLVTRHRKHSYSRLVTRRRKRSCLRLVVSRAYWKTIFLKIHFAPLWLLCSRSIQNTRKKRFLISTTGTVSKMTFYFTKEFTPKYKGKYCILILNFL